MKAIKLQPNKYQFDFTGMSRERSRKELSLLCAKIEGENNAIKVNDLRDDLMMAAKGMVSIEKFAGNDAYVCFTVSVPFNEKPNELVRCGKYVSTKAKIYTSNSSCASNSFFLSNNVEINGDAAQFKLNQLIVASNGDK